MPSLSRPTSVRRYGPVMTTVLCYGIAVQDLLFQLDEMPTDAVKYRAKGFAESGGGTAANASVAIARLGAHAHLASVVGEDMVGGTILAGLEKEGVDCIHVQRLSGVTSPLSAVIVDDAGERLVVNYKDPGLPDGPSFVPDDLSGIDAVHADVRWQDGSELLFQRAKALNIPRILDADRAPLNPGLLIYASHIAFSAVGLREMTGQNDLTDGLKAVSNQTNAELSVTEGENGVLWLDADTVRHIPAFPIKSVDTLGAGDVFHGALTLALAEGCAHEDALQFASAAAALKCTRFGGRAGVPDRSEVEALLETRKT